MVGNSMLEKEFKAIEKIDAHVHINTDKTTFLEQAEEDNFKLISINTDVPEYPSIDEQKQLIKLHMKAFPNLITYVSTFEMKGWLDHDWQEKTIVYLKKSLTDNAIAVKVWKNIGMQFKDENGKFILIDHPRFDPIFEFLVRNEIPVLGHLCDPKNCWMQIEKMTMKNDRIYFSEHPEYHMYLHPECYSYEDHIRARDHLLEKFRELRYIGCHLGSLEWNLDELVKRFESFRNMAVDTADRLCHIQYQSMRDRNKVYEFFLNYQDRIIYGTDLETNGNEYSDDLKRKIHNKWLRDWRYLTTDEWMTDPDVDGKFKGLALPQNIVEKIYRINAHKWLKKIKF